MRKVDDFKLIEMLKNGVQQKEIAAYFKVSPSYITKRKGQLEAVKEPESFSHLTDKQKQFALCKAEGRTNTDAAMIAFDVTSRESAKVLGCNTMKDPDVTTAIQDLLYQEGLGRRKRIKRLRDIIEAKDLGIVAKGLDMANKLTGEYAPERINLNSQISGTHILIELIKDMEAAKKAAIPDEDLDDDLT